METFREYRSAKNVCHGQQFVMLKYLICVCRVVAPSKHYKPIC